MKKHLRLTSFGLAAVILLILPSCTNETAASPKQTQTDVAPQAEISAADETKPETEPFDIPPETGELVIYSNSMTRSVLNAAVEIYKDMYPDVEVTYTNMADDTYEDIIKTELAAGAGPDILYTLDYYIADAYKLILSNIFMNLDGFMDSDDSFIKDDYIP